MVVGFCGILLFFFLPESFWDRTPRPRSRKSSRQGSKVSLFDSIRGKHHAAAKNETVNQVDGTSEDVAARKSSIRKAATLELPPRPSPRASSDRSLHVEFAGDQYDKKESEHDESLNVPQIRLTSDQNRPRSPTTDSVDPEHTFRHLVQPAGGVPPTPALHNLNSPFYEDVERGNLDYLTSQAEPSHPADPISRTGSPYYNHDGGTSFPPLQKPPVRGYTNNLRDREKLTFAQQLKPYNGRLTHDKWLRVAIRPFILFAYPAVLWSAGVYACSIGWLIVLSESVAVVYRSKSTYGFSALSTGLIYLSPFIGGVLGTAVAGKLSDVIVRAMSRRNGGLYEPEFRLVMAVPVAITTVIGLMGFGWSAQIHDAWIVPTIFFGVISFGCSLGSTTAITFCVDSYRQYAGEALVTLNFSKNIFHGLVFSLFFNKWLEADGTRRVFIWLGVIQLIMMAFTVPMYIFGKRARMWTVRKNLMEKF